MTLIASCHCGATRIELPQPTEVRTCNCTYCGRAGAVWAYYKPSQLRFLSQEGEATYAPGGLNRHHFCSACGMQTWGDSPDWASMYNADGTPKNGDPNAMPTERIFQVNLNLVDGFDFSSVTIERLDGRNSW
jgi:hypothetical protein